MELSIKEARGISDVYTLIKDKDLPIKTSYELARALKKIQEDIDFYTNSFQKIIDDFSEKDENGNPVSEENGRWIRVKPEFEEECSKKVEELEALKTEIDLEPITLDKLGNINISPEMMEKLMPILVPFEKQVFPEEPVITPVDITPDMIPPEVMNMMPNAPITDIPTVE